MTYTNPIFKPNSVLTAACIAALTLGACASTSEKAVMADRSAAADSGVMDTDIVTTSTAMSDAPSTLILQVSGYKQQSGQIMVAVYNSQAAFDSEGAPLRGAQVAVESAETSVTFAGLPVGDYAFKVFHDVNGNGELDTNAFGMPTEKYAFSRDASDPFSAPEWDESKITVTSGENMRNVSLD